MNVSTVGQSTVHSIPVVWISMLAQASPGIVTQNAVELLLVLVGGFCLELYVRRKKRCPKRCLQSYYSTGGLKPASTALSRTGWVI